MGRKKRPDFSGFDDAVAAWAKALGAGYRKVDAKSRKALREAIDAHPKAAWSDALDEFEGRLGGVELAAEDETSMLVLGAAACFAAGLPFDDAGRVPVGWMGDRVYYLDGKDRFWDRDEVFETKASRFAKGIDAFVCLAVAWCFQVHTSPRGGIPGLRGRGIAKERDLPELEGRSKTWGDASRVVFEQSRGGDKRTYVAGPSMETLFPRSTRRTSAAALRYMGENSDVNAWYNGHTGAKKHVLKYLRELVIRGDKRIEECMDGALPTFTYKGELARIAAEAETDAALTFPQGAQIPGEHARLEGSDGNERVLRIETIHDGNQAKRDIAKIVTAWCDWRDADEL
ncbi:MAG: hypothetical protein AAF645_05355 [Myxococcota bacterium]